jgi:release factor glutamine methyltransferase
MRKKTKTISQALSESRLILECRKIADARLAAEIILAHVLKSDRACLYKNYSEQLSLQQLSAYTKLIRQHLEGMPVSRIIGKKEFMSLNFKINRHVLSPRPETEILVEETLRLMESGKYEKLSILDIGTGSGNIAISVAKLTPVKQAHIFASDISAPALKVARQNARINGVEKLITFSKGDLFRAFRPFRLEGKVDFILANPPYIAPREYRKLPASVRKYGPKQALYAADDGLYYHRQIMETAPRYLRQSGYLLMEMGIGQEIRLKKLTAKLINPNEIKTLRDYNGISRILSIRYL